MLWKTVGIVLLAIFSVWLGAMASERWIPGFERWQTERATDRALQEQRKK